MPIMNTGSYQAEFAPVAHHFFMAAEKALDPIYPKIFEVHASKDRFERDIIFGGLRGAGVVPEGRSVDYDAGMQGPNKDYAYNMYGTGFIITKQMVDDAKDGIFMKKSSMEMRWSLNEMKEDLLASYVDNAFNSAQVGADGKELCATNHPIQDGLTIANELAVAADVSEDALEQMLVDIQSNMRDYRGKRVSVSPVALIIPHFIEADVNRILKSPLRSGTADHDLNYLKGSSIANNIIVHNRLADQDAFFIKTDVRDGLKVYQRYAPYIKSHNDGDTENMKFFCKEGYSYGHSDYRVLFGSPGA